MQTNTGVIGSGQESALHRQLIQMRPLSASASLVFCVVVTSNRLFLTILSHQRLFIYQTVAHTQRASLMRERAHTQSQTPKRHLQTRAKSSTCLRMTGVSAAVSHLISRLHENLFVQDRVCNNKPASLRELSRD